MPLLRFMSVAVTRSTAASGIGRPCGPAMPSLGARLEGPVGLGRIGRGSEAATIGALRGSGEVNSSPAPGSTEAPRLQPWRPAAPPSPG